MKILLVDDDAMLIETLVDFLQDHFSHELMAVSRAELALEKLRAEHFPLVITDINMPGMSGLELLRQIKALPQKHTTDVVIMTGLHDINTTIEALRAGAYDFLRKPVSHEELSSVINRCTEHLALLSENTALKTSFADRLSQATEELNSKLKQFQNFYAHIFRVGEIGIFSETMRAVQAVALKYHEDRSVPVLIEGETGTGKEVVTRLIHYGQGRVEEPFIPINCTSIPPTLFESELFGYEPGAFTGAHVKGMSGKFELADTGTIFLDEIGDMPLEIQAKLLRVIQEREIYRIGGQKPIPLDIRIICATNQSLAELVRERRFRPDLYYRLNVGRIFLPALRERKEEIEPLAYHFLRQFCQQKKKTFSTIHPQAVEIMKAYGWPGNVRELQNAIERVVLLYDDSVVRPEHLSFISVVPPSAGPVAEEGGAILSADSFELPEEAFDLEAFERAIVRRCLERFEGNKTRTAEYLGLSRSALRSRL